MGVKLSPQSLAAKAAVAEAKRAHEALLNPSDHGLRDRVTALVSRLSATLDEDERDRVAAELTAAERRLAALVRPTEENLTESRRAMQKTASAYSKSVTADYVAATERQRKSFLDAIGAAFEALDAMVDARNEWQAEASVAVYDDKLTGLRTALNDITGRFGLKARVRTAKEQRAHEDDAKALRALINSRAKPTPAKRDVLHIHQELNTRLGAATMRANQAKADLARFDKEPAAITDDGKFNVSQRRRELASDLAIAQGEVEALNKALADVKPAVDRAYRTKERMQVVE